MARQINRDSVKRVYMARITGTGWNGQPQTLEFGPYLVKSAASGAVTREIRNRTRYRAELGDWTGKVLSAPVGEWTEEP